MVTCQLQVERGTGKVRQSTTGVLLQLTRLKIIRRRHLIYSKCNFCQTLRYKIKAFMHMHARSLENSTVTHIYAFRFSLCKLLFICNIFIQFVDLVSEMKTIKYHLNRCVMQNVKLYNITCKL